LHLARTGNSPQSPAVPSIAAHVSIVFAGNEENNSRRRRPGAPVVRVAQRPMRKFGKLPHARGAPQSRFWRAKKIAASSEAAMEDE